MKIIRLQQQGQNCVRVNRCTSKALVFVSLLLCLAFIATAAGAAQIAFTPSSVAVVLKPGEQASLPYSVFWSGGTRGSSAVFSVAQTGGSLEGSWISSNGALSVGGPSASRAASLQLAIPANAAAGNYSGVFGATNISSNTSVSSGSFTVNLQVEAVATCTEAPTISTVTASQGAIQTKNNKPVTLTFSGTVTNAENCEKLKVWLELTDEYAELGGTQEISLSGDGSFSVPVTLQAFRKGSDKDGRLYTLSFGAENEAGPAEPQGAEVVVSHDNRK